MFWTKYHVYTLLPAFIVEIIAAIIIGKALKNKSDKVKMIPIQIVTIILLALEVAKQIYGLATGYDTYWIPLHFCSLFLYFMPLASFYFGKYKNQARVLAAVISACLFFFMAIYPNLIYSGEAIVSAGKFLTGKGGWFIDFHSVIFHMIALFSFFLFATLDVLEFKTKKDMVLIWVAFAIYCVIVGPLSQIIDTNFNNFVRCNAPFLEDVRLKLVESLSWGGQTIYVVMISIGTIIVPTISYFAIRGAKLICKKII